MKDLWGEILKVGGPWALLVIGGLALAYQFLNKKWWPHYQDKVRYERERWEGLQKDIKDMSERWASVIGNNTDVMKETKVAFEQFSHEMKVRMSRKRRK